IIHAEMPKQVEGLMWGFQLWVNLPSDEKMSEPDWHDFPSATIPEVKSDDALVRVISGQYQQQEGPVRAPGRDFLMLDVHLGKEAFSLPSQGQKRRLLYVYQGSLTVNGELAKEGELLVLDPADTLTCTTDEGARFILLAAKPIEEPIAQYGPFVMNNSGEIEQAIKDYQAGTLAANQKLS
ncbi:MAG: hypothetical protein CMF11_02350, partial [Idiomarina sp.]|nr:hypothetical protein [Idiomarina sp.]